MEPAGSGKLLVFFGVYIPSSLIFKRESKLPTKLTSSLFMMMDVFRALNLQ